jgi:hypothetical protein
VNVGAGLSLLVLRESQVDVTPDCRFDPIVSKVAANTLAGTLSLSAQSGSSER